MRRILSLFMVMLLVLRGLAGDAMAMEIPSAHSSAQVTALAHDMVHAMNADADHGMPAAQPMHHAMHEHADQHNHADQSGHAGNTAADAGCGSATSSGHCSPADGHCTACGICHSALAHPSLPCNPCSAPHASLAPHGAEQFASAPAASLVKPPISAL